MSLLFSFLILVQQSPTDTLTLERALELARSRRGAAALVAADVARARAELRSAGAVPNPIGGYSHTEDTPRQHLSVEQSFEWLFTRGTDRAAGRASLQGAHADSAQAIADLTAEVRSAFYGAVAAMELERLTREQMTLADSMVVVAGNRLAAGDIPLLEKEQLRLEAFRASQRHARAAEAAAVGRTVLATAIGVAVNDFSQPPGGALSDGLDALPMPVDAPSGLTPKLRAAISDSEAAGLRALRWRRAQVPMPTVQLGADWGDPATEGRLLAVFGVTLPLPTWQHGTGATAVAVAESDRSNAALKEARGLEAQRLRETDIRLRYAADRAKVARDSLLPLARQIRAKARVAYEAGESGLTQLLEALRTERDVAAEALDDLLAWQDARTAWGQVRGSDR